MKQNQETTDGNHLHNIEAATAAEVPAVPAVPAGEGESELILAGHAVSSTFGACLSLYVIARVSLCLSGV